MNAQRSRGYKFLQINFVTFNIMLRIQIITTSTLRESYKNISELGTLSYGLIKCFSDGGEICALVSNCSGKYLNSSHSQLSL